MSLVRILYLFFKEKGVIGVNIIENRSINFILNYILFLVFYVIKGN